MDTSLIVKLYPVICLEGPRRAMENLGQDSRWSGRNTNLAPPEYKSERLPLYPAFLLVG
jgi:hypothetical protein